METLENGSTLGEQRVKINNNFEEMGSPIANLDFAKQNGTTQVGGVEIPNYSFDFEKLMDYLKTLPGYSNDVNVSLRGDLTWAELSSSNQLTRPTLSIGAVTANSITINFTKSTNSTTTVMQRATNSTFTVNLIETDGLTATSFVDEYVSLGVEYFYRVKARGAGYTDSAFSTPASATPVSNDYVLNFTQASYVKTGNVYTRPSAAYDKNVTGYSALINANVPFRISVVNEGSAEFYLGIHPNNTSQGITNMTPNSYGFQWGGGALRSLINGVDAYVSGSDSVFSALLRETDGTIKLQDSADRITWVTKYTFTPTQVSAVYPYLLLSGGTGPKCVNPLLELL